MTSEQQWHTRCARLATSEHLRAQIVKNEYLFSLSACGKAVPWFSRGSTAVGQAAAMLAGGPKATADTRGGACGAARRCDATAERPTASEKAQN